MPKISILIPAFNEEKVISECLSSLVAQTFQDFEALIIDDASTDNTKSLIESFAAAHPHKIILKEYGKVGPGRARNRAAKDATGEFLVFTDADCVATTTWLEEIVKGFDHESVGSTGGPHLAHPSSTDFQLKVEDFFSLTSFAGGFYKKNSDFRIRETSHNPLCNVAYRSEIFHRLNGFKEDLWPGEDVEMDLKVKDAGFKITYNPRAVVYHHRPETIQQFRKVMHAYGRSQGKMVRDRGPRRLLHWIGLFVIGFLFLWCLTVLSRLRIIGFIFIAIVLHGIFRFRPTTATRISIFANAAQWLNGFIEGLWTGRSDPPGPKPL